MKKRIQLTPESLTALHGNAISNKSAFGPFELSIAKKAPMPEKIEIEKGTKTDLRLELSIVNELIQRAEDHPTCGFALPAKTAPASMTLTIPIITWIEMASDKSKKLETPVDVNICKAKDSDLLSFLKEIKSQADITKELLNAVEDRKTMKSNLPARLVKAMVRNDATMGTATLRSSLSRGKDSDGNEEITRKSIVSFTHTAG
jgi:hypothetical protein